MRDIGIGALSSRTNVPVANIRYYEEIGILPKPSRRNGRNRTYDESDVKRLVFVRNSRELGFSLDQVRTLIHLSDAKNLSCSEARELSKEQIKTVRQRIKELRLIEAQLSRHLIACEEACACGPVSQCPVLHVAS